MEVFQEERRGTASGIATLVCLLQHRTVEDQGDKDSPLVECSVNIIDYDNAGQWRTCFDEINI